tara:strand:+ start:77210 stop:78157 length:948 start_codon:yes stop_codon:yes gene_type:complete
MENKEVGLNDYRSIRKDQFFKWMQFIKERFHPGSHFLMIFLFLVGHYFVAYASQHVTVSGIDILFIMMGTAVFFLKLRFYDEIKDYELDLEIKPYRPLPRGLLTPFDVKKGIENCIVLEIIFFSACGKPGLLMILVSIGYSLLMYNEFFIPKLIRPHLTTYATTHTVVTLFLSLTIFSALGGQWVWNMDPDFYYFALMNWILFNIFELGRKTFQPEEEKNAIESYSKVWTRPGAFLLVLAQAILASYLLLQVSTLYFFDIQNYLIGTLILLVIIGLVYIFIPKKSTGHIYRAFSSLFIIIFYSIIIGNYIVRQFF